ncbi:hypothetical protein WJX81_005947 [Elliptochloris bilobata]|uniref:Sulfurtransferase n=1 Tax=Elliptochloris bilobata TaxID=381761 RepID=A0AAW1RUT2_9CHLO
MQQGNCLPTKLLSRQVRTRSAAAAAMDLPALVEPAWLRDRLDSSDMRVLDCTWYLPGTDKNPYEEFLASRIPGSRYFDLDKISMPDTGLPHMLPSPAAFGAAADALDISNSSAVVVYDRSGCFSAPRVWWTFRAFGHDRVAVLNGGLPAWLAEGLPLDEAPADEAALAAPVQAARSPPANPCFRAHLQEDLVRGLEEMRKLAAAAANGGGGEQVVDARPAARFAGTAAEPRAGVRSGHIPGSRSVPASEVVEGGRLRPANELATIFKAAGVDPGRPAVCSCGSGVTAAILALALHQLSPGNQVAVYDGSWSEWGSLPDTPVDTAD